jgi:hypothetical protein
VAAEHTVILRTFDDAGIRDFSLNPPKRLGRVDP